MNLNKIVIVVILLTLVLSAVTVPEGDGQGIIREFKDVHINMKASEKFSPEYEHRHDTEPERKRVMADYDQYGVILTNQRYVDVGTWTSDGLEGDMTMQGQVTFNIWFIEVSENAGGDNDPDWQFDLLYNGDSVAHVEVLNTASSDSEIIQITATANLNEPIHAVSGDTLGVYIQYKGWEDIDVYFDNTDYDSGASLSMDSIVIISADKSSARFYDAWGLNWELNAKFFSFINYGGTVNMGDNETTVEDGGTEQGTNGTTWQTNRIKFRNIEKGSGNFVSFTINYGPNGTSEGWSMDAGKGGDDDDDSDLPIAMIGGGLIVAVLAGVLVYFFIFKKMAEEEYDDEEESEDESEEYGDEEEEAQEEGVEEEEAEEGAEEEKEAQEEGVEEEEAEEGAEEEKGA